MLYAVVTQDGVMYGVVRLEDVAHIPLDPANTDYQQYLAWVEEGNVAEEWNSDIIEGEA